MVLNQFEESVPDVTIPDISDWNILDPDTRSQLLARPAQQIDDNLSAQVKAIIDDIGQRGDTAMLEYTARFDKVQLTSLQLTPAQLKTQADKVSPLVRKAIDTAYHNIYHFHQAQIPASLRIETSPGVVCEQRFAPLDSIGLYVPGGSASLPSTVLMGGVPAQIANCPRRVLISPPDSAGTLSPAICYAALKCGFTECYLGGGAQAIAALALGTDSIQPVTKILGPGNRYVTAAKQYVSQLSGGPAIDLPAGPSELLIIADDSAEPDFVAADLLSQAEHGADSQVVLLSPSLALLESVRRALSEQLASLPRATIAAQALSASRLILTASLAEAAAISNCYAPEHLSLQLAHAESWIEQSCTAGSIFVGHYSPESGGDYATGTNHILPTYGYARNYSSLGLLDFYRRYTVQTLTAAGLQALAPTITTLAAEEQLDAHRRAVTRRLESPRMRNDLSGEAQ